MSDYINLDLRTMDMGINLVTAADLLVPGQQWLSLHNVEPLQEGLLTTRLGRAVEVDLGNETLRVHSVQRISTNTILLGASTSLYRNNISLLTGLSGHPLSIVPGKDNLIYVGDSNKMRIVTEGGSSFQWGISPPQVPASFVTAGAGDLDSSVQGAVVYDWRFTYFSSITKTESLPSPTTNGISAISQQVEVGCTASNDPQVDQIRVYRRGGTVPNVWLLAAIVDNQTQTYIDNAPDAFLALDEPLRFDDYVPFTSEDAGGNALYGVPLGQVWGPFPLGQIMFACGDPNQPGRVYWTNAGRTGSADVSNFEDVTGKQEPLQNGFNYGSLPFVWSRDNLYALDFGNAVDPSFTARKTLVGRGLAGKWAFCVGPQVFFLSNDGIYVTDCQKANPQSITEDSLRPIFKGQSVPNQALVYSTTITPSVDDEVLGPVDYEDEDSLRMCYSGQEVHFFYKDTGGTKHHLIFHTLRGKWRSAGIKGVDTLTATNDFGAESKRILFGASNGKVYTPDPSLTQDEGGIPIEVKAKTGLIDVARLGFAQFGNLIVDAFPQDQSGNQVNIEFTLFSSDLYPLGDSKIVYVGPANLSIRNVKAFNIPSTTGVSAYGDANTLRGFFGLDIEWIGRAILYRVVVQHRTENEIVGHWDSGETTHGLTGWQHVKDLYLTLRANGKYILTVVVDGVSFTYNLDLSSQGFSKRKIYVPLSPVKGKVFRYVLDVDTVTPSADFVILGGESEIRVKPWNSRLGYRVTNPFVGGETPGTTPGQAPGTGPDVVVGARGGAGGER